MLVKWPGRNLPIPQNEDKRGVNGINGVNSGVNLTPVQEIVFNAVVLMLETEFSLPAEARSFLPIVKIKLRENLARTSEEVILRTLENLIYKTENLLHAAYNVSEGREPDSGYADTDSFLSVSPVAGVHDSGDGFHDTSAR